MTISLTKKGLVLLLCIVIPTQTVLASLAESHFWQERKQSLEKNNSNSHSERLASLPASFNPQSILNHLPSVAPSLSSLPKWTYSKKNKSLHLSIEFQKLVDAIPLSYASVQEVYEGGEAVPSSKFVVRSKHNTGLPRTVVLLQDVHLNSEAQNNIAAVLQQLIDQKKVGVVGVEGAFKKFDFTHFRAFPDKKITHDVAEAFLSKNILAAPSYVGITSETELPSFIGIDDLSHYKENVNVYLSTLKLKDKTKLNLELAEKELSKQKEKIFSPTLKSFDDLRTAYHAGNIGLGAYVKNLNSLFLPMSSNGEARRGKAVHLGKTPPNSPRRVARGDLPTEKRGEELGQIASDGKDFTVDQFLEAYNLESSLDFKKVDLERRWVIEKLAKVLTRNELSSLLAQGLAYRMGRISFADYYQGLRNLCESKGIPLHSTPAFNDYIRYVLLSDGINANKLFDSIDNLEKEVLLRAVQTSEEKTLLEQSEHLFLTKKLIEFSLTPKEWEKYQNLKNTEFSLPRRGEPLARPTASSHPKNRSFFFYHQESPRLGEPTARPYDKKNALEIGMGMGSRNVIDKNTLIGSHSNLSAFERFYEEADLRSQKMVENLFKSSSDIENKSSSLSSVLVVGGFHTPQIAKALREQKISYVVVSPKITKVDEALGSSYLSIFAREKESLDQLFKGDKLFLAPATVNGVAAGAKEGTFKFIATDAALHFKKTGQSGVSDVSVTTEKSNLHAVGSGKDLENLDAIVDPAKEIGSGTRLNQTHSFFGLDFWRNKILENFPIKRTISLLAFFIFPFISQGAEIGTNRFSNSVSNEIVQTLVSRGFTTNQSRIIIDEQRLFISRVVPSLDEKAIQELHLAVYPHSRFGFDSKFYTFLSLYGLFVSLFFLVRARNSKTKFRKNIYLLGSLLVFGANYPNFVSVFEALDGSVVGNYSGLNNQITLREAEGPDSLEGTIDHETAHALENKIRFDGRKIDHEVIYSFGFLRSLEKGIDLGAWPEHGQSLSNANKAYEFEVKYQNPQAGWDFLLEMARGKTRQEAIKIIKARYDSALKSNLPVSLNGANSNLNLQSQQLESSTGSLLKYPWYKRWVAPLETPLFYLLGESLSKWTFDVNVFGLLFLVAHPLFSLFPAGNKQWMNKSVGELTLWKIGISFLRLNPTTHLLIIPALLVLFARHVYLNWIETRAGPEEGESISVSSKTGAEGQEYEDLTFNGLEGERPSANSLEQNQSASDPSLSVEPKDEPVKSKGKNIAALAEKFRLAQDHFEIGVGFLESSTPEFRKAVGEFDWALDILNKRQFKNSDLYKSSDVQSFLLKLHLRRIDAFRRLAGEYEKKGLPFERLEKTFEFTQDSINEAIYLSKRKDVFSLVSLRAELYQKTIYICRQQLGSGIDPIKNELLNGRIAFLISRTVQSLEIAKNGSNSTFNADQEKQLSILKIKEYEYQLSGMTSAASQVLNDIYLTFILFEKENRQYLPVFLAHRNIVGIQNMLRTLSIHRGNIRSFVAELSLLEHLIKVFGGSKHVSILGVDIKDKNRDEIDVVLYQKKSLPNSSLSRNIGVHQIEIKFSEIFSRLEEWKPSIYSHQLKTYSRRFSQNLKLYPGFVRRPRWFFVGPKVPGMDLKFNKFLEIVSTMFRFSLPDLSQVGKGLVLDKETIELWKKPVPTFEMLLDQAYVDFQARQAEKNNPIENKNGNLPQKSALQILNKMDVPGILDTLNQILDPSKVEAVSQIAAFIHRNRPYASWDSLRNRIPENHRSIVEDIRQTIKNNFNLILVKQEDGDDSSTKGFEQNPPINSILAYYYDDSPWIGFFGMVGEMAFIAGSMNWAPQWFTYLLIAVIAVLHYSAWKRSQARGRAPPAWLATLSHSTLFSLYAYTFHLTGSLNSSVWIPLVFHFFGDLIFIFKFKETRLNSKSRLEMVTRFTEDLEKKLNKAQSQSNALLTIYSDLMILIFSGKIKNDFDFKLDEESFIAIGQFLQNFWKKRGWDVSHLTTAIADMGLEIMRDRFNDAMIRVLFLIRGDHESHRDALLRIGEVLSDHIEDEGLHGVVYLKNKKHPRFEDNEVLIRTLRSLIAICITHGDDFDSQNELLAGLKKMLNPNLYHPRWLSSYEFIDFNGMNNDKIMDAQLADIFYQIPELDARGTPTGKIIPYERVNELLNEVLNFESPHDDFSFTSILKSNKPFTLGEVLRRKKLNFLGFKPLTISEVEKRKVIRSNVRSIFSGEFSDVFFNESIGGNAGERRIVVNGYVDHQGRIVVFGNIQFLSNEVRERIERGQLLPFAIGVEISKDLRNVSYSLSRNDRLSPLIKNILEESVLLANERDSETGSAQKMTREKSDDGIVGAMATGHREMFDRMVETLKPVIDHFGWNRFFRGLEVARKKNLSDENYIRLALKDLEPVGISSAQQLAMLPRIFLVDTKAEKLNGATDRLGGLIIRHQGVLKTLLHRSQIKLASRRDLGDLLHELIEIELLEKNIPSEEAHRSAAHIQFLFESGNVRGAADAIHLLRGEKGLNLKTSESIIENGLPPDQLQVGRQYVCDLGVIEFVAYDKSTRKISYKNLSDTNPGIIENSDLSTNESRGLIYGESMQGLHQSIHTIETSFDRRFLPWPSNAGITFAAQVGETVYKSDNVFLLFGFSLFWNRLMSKTKPDAERQQTYKRIWDQMAAGRDQEKLYRDVWYCISHREKSFDHASYFLTLEEGLVFARGLLIEVFKETGEDLIKSEVVNSFSRKRKWSPVSVIEDRMTQTAVPSGKSVPPLHVDRVYRRLLLEQGLMRWMPEAEYIQYARVPLDVSRYFNQLLIDQELKISPSKSYREFSDKLIVTAGTYYSLSNPKHNGDSFSQTILMLKNPENPKAPELAEEMLSQHKDQIERNLPLQEIDVVIGVPAAKSGRNNVGHYINALKKLFPQTNWKRSYGVVWADQRASQKSMKTFWDRVQNVFGVFKVTDLGKKDVSGKTVLVVDDVSTTGATLFEIQRILYEAGAKKVVLFSAAKSFNQKDDEDVVAENPSFTSLSEDKNIFDNGFHGIAGAANKESDPDDSSSPKVNVGILAIRAKLSYFWNSLKIAKDQLVNGLIAEARALISGDRNSSLNIETRVTQTLLQIYAIDDLIKKDLRSWASQRNAWEPFLKKAIEDAILGGTSSEFRIDTVVNEGRVEGYIVYRLEPNEPRTMKIDTLAIHPSAQGKGLGLQLIYKALNHFKTGDLNDIILGCEKNNTRANQFYRNLPSRKEFSSIIKSVTWVDHPADPNRYLYSFKLHKSQVKNDLENSLSGEVRIEDKNSGALPNEILIRLHTTFGELALSPIPDAGLLSAQIIGVLSNPNISKLVEQLFNAEERIKLESVLKKLFSQRIIISIDPLSDIKIERYLRLNSQVERMKYEEATEGLIKREGGKLNDARKKFFLQFYRQWQIYNGVDHSLSTTAEYSSAIKYFEKEISVPFQIPLFQHGESSAEVIILAAELLKLLPHSILASPDFQSEFKNGIDVNGTSSSAELNKLTIASRGLSMRTFVQHFFHEAGHGLYRKHLGDHNSPLFHLFRQAHREQNIYQMPAMDYKASIRHVYISESGVNLENKRSEELFAETFMHYILLGPLMKKGFPGRTKNPALWQEIYAYYRDHVFGGKEYDFTPYEYLANFPTDTRLGSKWNNSNSKPPANSILSYYFDSHWIAVSSMAAEMMVIVTSMIYGSPLLTFTLIAIIYGGHHFGWIHANEQGRAPPRLLAFLSHTSVFLLYAATYFSSHQFSNLVFIPLAIHLITDVYLIYFWKPLETFNVVALDGPAGAGKSTVAKGLAKKMGYLYMDSGALYRSITYEILRRGIDPTDKEKILKILPSLNVVPRLSENGLRVFVNDVDVTAHLREPKVSDATPKLAELAEVHQIVFTNLRKLVNTGAKIVIDGRNVGTDVFPKTKLKFYLFADDVVRAQRRLAEYQTKGHTFSLIEVLKQIQDRDKSDESRAYAPLRKAKDAILFDTGDLSAEGNVEALFSQITEILNKNKSRSLPSSLVKTLSSLLVIFLIPAFHLSAKERREGEKGININPIELTKSETSVVKSHDSSKEIAGKLMGLVKSKSNDRELLAKALFDIVDTEKILEPSNQQLFSNQSALWRDVSSILQSELKELIQSGEFNTKESQLRLADLIVILRHVLSEKEFNGFIGLLSNIPIETALGPVNGSASWVESTEQMIPSVKMLIGKMNEGTLKNSDRFVFGFEGDSNKAIEELNSKLGGRVNQLISSKHLVLIPTPHTIRAIDFIALAKNSLEGLGSKEGAINLLILEGVDLPPNFFPESPSANDWEQLRQSAIVYFVTKSLLAIQLDVSLLPDWNAVRTRLIQA